MLAMSVIIVAAPELIFSVWINTIYVFRFVLTRIDSSFTKPTPLPAWFPREPVLPTPFSRFVGSNTLPEFRVPSASPNMIASLSAAVTCDHLLEKNEPAWTTVSSLVALPTSFAPRIVIPVLESHFVENVEGKLQLTWSTFCILCSPNPLLHTYTLIHTLTLTISLSDTHIQRVSL